MKNIVNIEKQGRFWVVIINGLECEWYQMKAAAVEAARRWRKLWFVNIAAVLTRTTPGHIASAKNIFVAIAAAKKFRTATDTGMTVHSFARIAWLNTWKMKMKLPAFFRRYCK